MDWDEAAIAASDAELAALSSDGTAKIGRTRSGSPMVRFAATSFAEWFRQRTGYDHRSLSDRDRLAEDRTLRERVKAEAGQSGPQRQRVGGSWPTSGSPGLHPGGGFGASVHT